MLLKELLKKNECFNKIYNNFFVNNEDQINKWLREIKNDKLFYKKITKIFNNKINDQVIINNLASILFVKKDLEFCNKNCPGFEKCSKDYQHYNWMLKKINENYLTCILTPCKYKLDYLKLDEAYSFDEFNYLGSFRDFPFSWHFSKISELDKSKSRLLLFKEYKKIIDDKKKWLFICGSHRSGKSFIAAVLSDHLISIKHQKIAFINCVDRIKYLHSIYFNNKDEFDNLVKLYSNVAILVLDDFGSEYKNEFIRDNIVLKILDYRIKKNLVTIFTSNFNYDEISRMYSINNFGRTCGEQLKKMLMSFAGNEIDISTVSVY